MLARINTAAFNGLEILDVDLQIKISSGMPCFTIVGLPDKAVAESRERVHAALGSLGLQLPAKRIVVNLAPADLLKEGSHYDLPLALGLLAVMEVLPQEDIAEHLVLGELGLDGSIIPVSGVLPAAIHANAKGWGLVCPRANGAEAAWSGLKNIAAPESLLSLVNHFKGLQVLPQPVAATRPAPKNPLDMADVKGQEFAKRALEIAAAGGHNVLMVGPPGSGKSMLASRLPTILPPLSTREALETSIIRSVAGALDGGEISFERPYRDPHHNASMPALVGGGRRATPGEISLAHNGVLFLDELPEFPRAALEALRQPLENGKIAISRVNAHTTYPARFQLVAAMNPCRCGHLGDRALECKRAPLCAEEYQNRISGPLLDRIDIHIEVPAVSPADLAEMKKGESSGQIRARVVRARQIQAERFRRFSAPELSTNAELRGEMLESAAALEADAKALLVASAEKMRLSARGYHRVLRLARTIADLQNETNVAKMHLVEALAYRRIRPSG